MIMTNIGRWLNRVFVLTVLFPVSGCNSAPPGRYDDVYIRVEDAESGEPLRAAIVGYSVQFPTPFPGSWRTGISRNIVKMPTDGCGEVVLHKPGMVGLIIQNLTLENYLWMQPNMEYHESSDGGRWYGGHNISVKLGTSLDEASDEPGLSMENPLVLRMRNGARKGLGRPPVMK